MFGQQLGGRSARSSALLVFSVSLGLSTACDDKKTTVEIREDEVKSVKDGAEPRSAAGAQLKNAQQRIQGAEAALHARDQGMNEQSVEAD